MKKVQEIFIRKAKRFFTNMACEVIFTPGQCRRTQIRIRPLDTKLDVVIEMLGVHAAMAKKRYSRHAQAIRGRTGVCVQTYPCGRSYGYVYYVFGRRPSG